MVNLTSRVVKMCGYVCKKRLSSLMYIDMMYIFYHHNIVPIGSMYGIFTYNLVDFHGLCNLCR